MYQKYAQQSFKERHKSTGNTNKSSVNVAQSKGDPNNAPRRRKLKNENLELMLKSSEFLLEDFVELEAQVSD